jgi:vacuolar-type H+-ATPase subunit I/STV1
MKVVKLTKEEMEVIRRYKQIQDEAKVLEERIKALKDLADDDTIELVYRGSLVAKIIVTEVKRVDLQALPKEIKEKYVKINKEKRLVITGIPSEPQEVKNTQ